MLPALIAYPARRQCNASLLLGPGNKLHGSTHWRADACVLVNDRCQSVPKDCFDHFPLKCPEGRTPAPPESGQFYSECTLLDGHAVADRVLKRGLRASPKKSSPSKKPFS